MRNGKKPGSLSENVKIGTIFTGDRKGRPYAV